MAHTHNGNEDALTGVGRLFAMGVALNVGFALVEALFGWRAALLAVPGVHGLHELHVWGMATSETALTAHLVIDAPQQDRDMVLRSATQALEARFKIGHVTLQIESTDCPSDVHC